LLTNAQMVREISEFADVSATDVKAVMNALEIIVLDEIEGAQKVKIGQLVQIQPKVRKARKKRMGRNPRTGEEVEISAKPADVVIRARVLKRVKDAAPSVQKARKAGA
jgi:nucleoid DNA-binding protein